MNIEVRKILEKGVMNYETIQDLKLEKDITYILGIDASTTCTGLCVYDLSKRVPVWTIAVKRDDDEGKIRYKLRLKKLIETLLINNPSIRYSEYEEPFIEYVDSASDLIALSPIVEEIKIENEPNLDYLEHELVPNKRWKKALLGDRLPSGSDLEKNAITCEIYRLYPQLVSINGQGLPMHFTTQDERDATGLCVAKDKELRGEVTELKSVKVRPFKYEIEFVGGEDMDDAIEFVEQLKSIPRVVRSNGMAFTELKRGEKFDTKILQTMQNDDIICIIEFDTNVAGNLYVKYKLASYKKYPKVYAIVWRSNRKKAQK